MAGNGYDDVSLLRDRNGRPIPQYYDDTSGTFKPLGKDVVISGGNVRKAMEITPDDDADLTTTVLSLTCTENEGIVYCDFVDGGENIPVYLSLGHWNPVAVKRVRETSSTAIGIVGQVI